MEIVRYRPGEALRWLLTEAEALHKEARDQGRSAVAPGDLKHRVGQAAAAAATMGKGTYTRLLHERAQAWEYVLQEDRLDVVQPGKIKTIPYASIRSIRMRGAPRRPRAGERIDPHPTLRAPHRGPGEGSDRLVPKRHRGPLRTPHRRARGKIRRPP